MRRVSTMVLLAALIGCEGEPASNAATALDLNTVLGGDNVEGYLRADAPRDFSFPRDHGPHAGFRNEWWYFTGNVSTVEGRRFGYQVTFFNAAVSAFAEASAGQARDAANVSAWHSERLWMAHVALTDVDGGEHYPLERFSRENPGLAGATLEPFRVWLEDWQLTGDAEGPWHLRVTDDAFSLDLDLTASKPPVLQGADGLSQKSPEPGNASYYYSMTRIATAGSIELGGESFTVSGTSWLDREWSTSALGADQSGWDWFSLQFDDGQELMYYQLRTNAGATHPNSAGNWTDVSAQQTLITPADIALEEVNTWTSPSGVVYTTAWNLRYRGKRWRVEAVVDDQLMALSIPYWEGAVDVVDENGASVGRGYLEMVRP
jgi:predicted secreted hydrolase